MVQYLERPNRPKLAFCHSESAGAGKALPAVMFLGGYASDMTGTKAAYLEEQCRARGQAFVRFDYSGHGASEGRFEDGTIGLWKDDARAVLEALIEGPVILAGSSMGGWIALLLARELPQRVAGMTGMAAAPDFTRDITKALTPAQRRELEEKGWFALPNRYGNEPYRITKVLLEDGEKHCLLDHENDIAAPVRLVHGMKDEDVPWQTAFRIKNAIPEGDVTVLLAENGNHRLTRPEDLALIDAQVRALSGI
jgi:pimeloyl-ACP methyl ester carboxylesterase